jgi:TPR repeat protein
MGELYWNIALFKGQGVRSDYAKAVEYVRRTVTADVWRAQCYLGLAYERGQGGTADIREATKWHELSSAGDDTHGQFHLG